MSLLSAFFSFSKLTKTSAAIKSANMAVTKFTAYAKTDNYTALYELVTDLQSRTDLTGAQKSELVLKSFASDVALFGKYFIKSVIETVLSSE